MAYLKQSGQEEVIEILFLEEEEANTSEKLSEMATTASGKPPTLSFPYKYFDFINIYYITKNDNELTWGFFKTISSYPQRNNSLMTEDVGQ